MNELPTHVTIQNGAAQVELRGWPLKYPAFEIGVEIQDLGQSEDDGMSPIRFSVSFCRRTWLLSLGKPRRWVTNRTPFWYGIWQWRKNDVEPSLHINPLCWGIGINLCRHCPSVEFGPVRFMVDLPSQTQRRRIRSRRPDRFGPSRTHGTGGGQRRPASARFSGSRVSKRIESRGWD